MLNQLIDIYDTWTEKQGLPPMSADELVWEDCVNADQRKWLQAFITMWDETVEINNV